MKIIIDYLKTCFQCIDVELIFGISFLSYIISTAFRIFFKIIGNDKDNEHMKMERKS